ncbi:MAG: molecular chaperone DnaJ [Candidatus Margulisbacteria bacterium]|nr:molecular chaperone DnaJ [Candidatus Margulisiibacteriota bacterium]
MANKDYYDILGVPKNASADEIKRAYRKKAREYHPDVNKDPGAEQKFKQLSEAYSVLTDDKKRAHYDRFGTAQGFPGAGPGAGGFGGFEGFDFEEAFGGGFGESFSDIFENFFGGGVGNRGRGRAHKEKRRGDDLRYDLTINLEEAAFGKEMEIEIPHLAKCATCNGSGAKPGTKEKKCSACGGTGQVRHVQQTILGSFTQVGPCAECGGEGKIISETCSTCRGMGRVKKNSKVKIKIPSGVETGMKLRVSGEGNAGLKGGSPGDLYIYIQVKEHAIFEREEDDIISKEKISFVLATLGGEIKVKTLDGEVKLKIPSGTQPETRFRLKERGIPHLQKTGRGDHYVLIEVEIPTVLSSKQKKLLEEFEKTK